MKREADWGKCNSLSAFFDSLLYKKVILFGTNCKTNLYLQKKITKLKSFINLNFSFYEIS